MVTIREIHGYVNNRQKMLLETRETYLYPQEGITSINTYKPNRDPKYMKKKLKTLRGEIKFKNKFGNFNSPLSIMDRKTIHKMSKCIENLNRSINKTNLTNSRPTNSRIHILPKYTRNSPEETIC